MFARGDEDRMTSANGTFETFRDVRSVVAIGGKAEMTRIVHFGSFGPKADIDPNDRHHSPELNSRSLSAWGTNHIERRLAAIIAAGGDGARL